MVRTSLFLLIFGFFCLVPLAAEEPVAQASTQQSAEGRQTIQPAKEALLPPLVVTGNELVADLDDAMARVADLTTKSAGVEGEDLRILKRQIIDVKIEYLDTLHRLVRNLLEQEKKGLPTGATRGRVENDLLLLPAAFVEHIEETDDQIAEIRLLRDEADPADRLNLESRISRRATWLDTLYKSYAELTVLLEAVGLDPGPARADLITRATTRADSIGGRLQLVGEQLKQANQRAAETPDDPAIKLEIQVLQEQRTSLSRAMGDTAGVLDRLGLDTSGYRKTLIQSTGEVTTDLFRSGVLTALIADWFVEVQNWFRTSGRGFLFRLIVFCFVLLVSRIVASIAKRLLTRGFGKTETKKSTLLMQMVQGLTVRTIMILGFLFGLTTLGIELGPVLAGLGIAGFIVGFALQDTLSNFAAGVMILVYRPFDMGDMIEAGGVFGSVDKLSLVSTTILTIDNQTLIVPNSKIWGDVIKNVTNQKMRRIDLKFLISYAEDLERIERLFLGILEEHPKVLDDPPPMVKLHALGDYAMEFVVRPWVATEDYWEVRWDLMREVKRKLDAEGIAIPLPGRDVRLTQN